MGASFRGHASGPMGMRAQQEEQSLLRVRGGRCPPGMGGASRSQGGVSARLRGRGRVGALSQPGGPAPGTLVGAEAPLAVVVVAVRGGAPQLAVAAAFAGAALVLFAQEGEGEDAGRAFRVPANSGHDCGVGDTRQGQRGAQAPPPPGTTTVNKPPLAPARSRARGHVLYELPPPRDDPAHWGHFKDGEAAAQRDEEPCPADPAAKGSGPGPNPELSLGSHGWGRRRHRQRGLGRADGANAPP